MCPIRLELLQIRGIQPWASSYYPIPFCKRTDPEITVMLGTYFVPTQIEQIADSSMDTQKPLRLTNRFELSHSSLPDPSRLMRLFRSIILVLLGTVDRLRNQFPMSNTIASQRISHDLPGLIAMTAQ